MTRQKTFEEIISSFDIKIGNNLDYPAFLDSKHKTIYLSNSTTLQYDSVDTKSPYDMMTVGLVRELYRENLGIKYQNDELNEMTKNFCESKFQFKYISLQLENKLKKNANGNRIANYK